MPAARKELASTIAAYENPVRSDLELSSLTPAQAKQVADWVIEKYSNTTDPCILDFPREEIVAVLRGN
jgi:hypothetical protein